MVNEEIERVKKLIGKIDYDVPEIRGIMHTDNIYDEKFSAGVPRIILDEAKQAIENFSLNPTPQGLEKLTNSYNKLVQLNKDFYWVVYTLTGQEFS